MIGTGPAMLPDGMTAQMPNMWGYERVNTAALRELLADPDLVNTISKSDRGTKGESLLRRLRDYASRVVTVPGLGPCVRVHYKRDGAFGRLVDVGPSYQNFPRPIRHLLAHGLHSDADIDCCHPTITHQYLARLGMDAPVIRDYSENSKAWRTEIMEDLGLDKDQAKKLLQAVCNGSGLHVPDSSDKNKRVPVDHPKLRAISREARAGIQLICQHNRHLLELCQASDHPQLTCATWILQGFECACLLAMWKKAKSLNLQPQMPIHDGFMPVVPPTEEHLRDMEEAILHDTGFSVKVSIKEVPSVKVSSLRQEFGDSSAEGDDETDSESVLGKRDREAEPVASQEEQLFLGGDMGLAKLYKLLRWDKARNAGGEDGDTFYVFDDESTLWRRRGLKYITSVELKHLVDFGERLGKELAQQGEEGRAKKVGVVTCMLRGVSTRKKVATDVAVILCDEDFAERLDRNPELLSVANGVVDLRTGQLRERRFDDYFTYAIEVPYVPDHEGLPAVVQLVRQMTLADRATEVKEGKWGSEWQASPIFDGCDKMPDMLQRVLGYSITGYIRHQALFAFLGGGSNGKSAITNLTKWAVRPIYTQASVDLLKHGSENTGGASPHIIALRGKRLGVISEWDSKYTLNERNYRTLTGDDELLARALYQKDLVSFENWCKIWLVVNELPNLDLSLSSMRRLFAMWFEAKFVPDDPSAPVPFDKTDPTHFLQVQDFEKGLSREAWLAFMIEGAGMYLADGFPAKPPCMTRFMDQIRSESDPLSGFFDEHVDTDGRTAEDAERVDDVYRAYASYVDKMRGKAMNIKAFKKAMDSKGFKCIRAKTQEHRDKWVFRRLRLM
ncbi:hypothetical protein JKP88DRAFT_315258 [Tribonema minus]|uniref:SF3 helicase domain-containing protein n=1 Tax=Tribonema minus TaxID=303371 RepID=A0A835Z0P8_9STRA|nr:hypothetical protein JKP88DRAFT_315258 [Tribonema minus]